MTGFIHLSDLHIRRYQHADENASLRFIVEHLLRRYEKTEKPIVLITGDVTDDGQESQYKNAVELLRPLKNNQFPLLIVPGNHDYGPAGNIYTNAALRRFEQIVLRDFLGYSVPEEGEFFPHVARFGSVVFIGVDSVVANEDAAFHFASGEIGAPQRRLLREAFAQVSENDTAVTYFHHHPFNRKRVMQMDDADIVMKLLSGRTDFLCFGHDHVAEIWRDHMGIDCILASGKTTSQNRRGQYSFSEIRIDGKDQHSVSTVSIKR